MHDLVVACAALAFDMSLGASESLGLHVVLYDVLNEGLDLPRCGGSTSTEQRFSAMHIRTDLKAHADDSAPSVCTVKGTGWHKGPNAVLLVQSCEDAHRLLWTGSLTAARAEAHSCIRRRQAASTCKHGLKGNRQIYTLWGHQHQVRPSLARASFKFARLCIIFANVRNSF